MAAALRTRDEHFIKGSRFLVNPGGKTKEFTIGISPNATEDEMNDLRMVFWQNEQWFKTLRIGFGESDLVNNQ